MTKKQIKTLVLFSQNFSINVIALKQKVSNSTIRERIRNLSKNYPREFNNASSVRQTYKRIRDKLRNTDRFRDIDNELGNINTKF